jgi:hypothetical protein
MLLVLGSWFSARALHGASSKALECHLFNARSCPVLDLLLARSSSVMTRLLLSCDPLMVNL